MLQLTSFIAVWSSNRIKHTDIIMQISPLVDDNILLPFKPFKKKKNKSVCRWIKLERLEGGSPLQGLEKNRIRIFFLSSGRIRYSYSSQVDPECSWLVLNTIAAFFVCFLYFFISSPHFYFSFHST